MSENNKIDDELIKLIFEQIKEQMALWKVWTEDMIKVYVEYLKSSSELAPIITAHWTRVQKILEQTLPEMLKHPENLPERQRELYQACALSYSQMLKEILASEAFGNYIKEVMGRTIDTKLVLNRNFEQLLETLRIPTKRDIDGINRNIYNLSRKLDMLYERVDELIQSEKTDEDRSSKKK